MNTRPLLDRLRAQAEGRLTPTEQELLEQELAADPRARRLAEDFHFVHSLTAGAHERAVSHLAFEELDLAPSRPARRVAAAAGLLLLAGGAFLAGRWSKRASEPLYLEAIALELPPAEPAAELPASWTDFTPRGEHGVRFLSRLDEARELARTLERPLLVYGSYPGCPLCATLDERVFSSPEVASVAERLVPVRLDLASLSEAEQRSFTARGYPFLELWRADGTTTHSLSRRPDPLDFVESLHDGLEKSGATGELLPWEDLRAAAARLREARAAEDARRVAEAEQGYAALAGEARTPELVRSQARAGHARLAHAARSALLEARMLAELDERAAEGRLETAVSEFAGTAYEADLRAALGRLREEGRFPALAVRPRS